MTTARLALKILTQPNDTTCGPTCLHAVYEYYGEPVPLERIIEEVPALQEGGTLAVFLACHALRRGFKATILTYNLDLFDPTWFDLPAGKLAGKLQQQMEAKPNPKLRLATEGFLEYLQLGGEVRFEDLTSRVVRRYLKRGQPILTGLSATYMYRTAREFGPHCDYDDVLGEPSGHFVLLCGYDPGKREVLVADPLDPNPLSDRHIYPIGMDRVLGAIMLGIVTYDANLLVLERPAKRRSRRIE